jgi:5-carboxymethyl-2-hydroxymuconic-semialdehyde dehydrogenase
MTVNIATSGATSRHVPAELPTHLQHYIDGQPRDSVRRADLRGARPGVELDVRHRGGRPGRRRRRCGAGRLARVHRRALADHAAARPRTGAEHASPTWSRRRIAALAELETFDTGLPITQALGQAQRAAENFRFFADVIVAQTDQAYKVPGRQLNYVNRKPVGVAGLITPWNTPFMLESWKLAPALASGCTVVLKPAEFTPLSASLWAQIFRDAGLPQGVFNLVNGIGEQAGAALVEHPGTRRSSPSPARRTTGQTIFRSAAAQLKGLSMELGGKSPVLVFADADLDAALDSALFGVFSLNGERCTAGSPHPRAARHLRRVRRAVRGARAEHRGRQPARPSAPRSARWCTRSTTSG